MKVHQSFLTGIKQAGFLLVLFFCLSPFKSAGSMKPVSAILTSCVPPESSAEMLKGLFPDGPRTIPALGCGGRGAGSGADDQDEEPHAPSAPSLVSLH